MLLDCYLAIYCLVGHNCLEAYASKCTSVSLDSQSRTEPLALLYQLGWRIDK